MEELTSELLAIGIESESAVVIAEAYIRFKMMELVVMSVFLAPFLYGILYIFWKMVRDWIREPSALKDRDINLIVKYENNSEQEDG